jgi:hypothetical protein
VDDLDATSGRWRRLFGTRLVERGQQAGVDQLEQDLLCDITGG